MEQLADAKVAQLDEATGVEEDIARLDVPVNNVPPVKVAHGGDHLHKERQYLQLLQRRRQRGEEVGQRPSVSVLRFDVEGATAQGEAAVVGDDVLVGEDGEDAHLVDRLLQLLPTRRIAGRTRLDVQPLQGDQLRLAAAAVHLSVEGDGAEGAIAEVFHLLVVFVLVQRYYSLVGAF